MENAFLDLRHVPGHAHENLGFDNTLRFFKSSYRIGLKSFQIND